MQTGDLLTLADFEHKYGQMAEYWRAELIDGVAYVTRPGATEDHARSRLHIVTWLGYYSAFTRLAIGSCGGSIRLNWDTEVQPDVILALAGGQSYVSEDGFRTGAPELIAEVMEHGESYELDIKESLYARNGVREYIVLRVCDRALDWFRLVDGQYVAQQPDSQGLLKSSVFPGLWLDAPAALANDYQRVLAVLQQGLASTEHAEFVAELERQRASRAT